MHTSDYGSLQPTLTPTGIEQIAMVCHEANRAYCNTIGDTSQLPWDEAPEWQRQSARNGVTAIAERRVTYPEQSHESWMAEKEAQGWTYGETKDAEKKTHPCFLPFSLLPKEQQRKDILFFNIVQAFLK